MTIDLLLGMARELGCEPLDLVQATVFEYLLKVAPDDCESTAVKELRAERDQLSQDQATLRAQLVAIGAQLDAVEGEFEEAQGEIEGVRTRAAALEQRLAEVDAARKTAVAQRDQEAQQRVSVRQELLLARREVQRRANQLAVSQAQAQEARKQLVLWRNWGQQQERRADFLQQQVDTLETQLSNGSTGAAVGGGIFGFAAGVLVGAAAAGD